MLTVITTLLILAALIATSATTGISQILADESMEEHTVLLLERKKLSSEQIRAANYYAHIREVRNLSRRHVEKASSGVRKCRRTNCGEMNLQERALEGAKKRLTIADSRLVDARRISKEAVENLGDLERLILAVL